MLQVIPTPQQSALTVSGNSSDLQFILDSFDYIHCFILGSICFGRVCGALTFETEHETVEVEKQFRLSCVESLHHLFIIDEILCRLMKEGGHREFFAWYEAHAAASLYRAKLISGFRPVLGLKQLKKLLDAKRSVNLYTDYNYEYVSYVNALYMKIQKSLTIERRQQFIYALGLFLLKWDRADILAESLDEEVRQLLKDVPDYAHLPELLDGVKDHMEEGEIFIDEVFPGVKLFDFN